jgi:hypothetical protein
MTSTVLCSSPGDGKQTNTSFCCKPKRTKKPCILASPTRPVSGFSSTRAVLALQHAPHTPHEDWISLTITEAIVNAQRSWEERTWNSFSTHQNLVLDVLQPLCVRLPSPWKSLEVYEQRNLVVCLRNAPMSSIQTRAP